MTNNKKVIFATVAVIIIAAYFLYTYSFDLAVGNILVYAQEDFETYVNEDYGFSIGYHEDWEVREYNLQENEVVNFLDNESPAGVVQIAIIEISASSPLQNATLKELVDQGIEIGKYDAKQINRVNMTIDGLPAEEKIYYQYQLGITVKSLEAITLTPDKELISIHYVSEPQFFNDNLETVRQMVSSFELIG